MNNGQDKQTDSVIDRYVLDELTGDDRTAFEKEMQQNEEFRKEVEWRQHIAIAFQRKKEAELLRRKSFITLYKKQLISIFSAAAVLLLLIHIGMKPLYPSGQLFEIYFNETDFERIPNRAFQTEDELQNEILFDRAIADLSQNRLPEAIDRLSHLYQTAPAGFEYREEAEWALALAYLKNNQRKDAQNMLNQIIEEGNPYSGKALELAGKLKARKWF